MTDANTVAVTVEDDDAGLVVSETTRTVDEASGETETYTVELAVQPTANVTVTPKSSDTLAAKVSPATLTFTQTTWDTKQTVTVTGVNDDAPGDRTAVVAHTAAGAGYSLTDVDTVTVTVEDDDAGLTVSETTRTVDEADGEAEYEVELAVQPTGNVTVTPTSSDTLAAKVSPATLTFTRDNWSTAKTVTVTGVGDAVVGDRTAVVSHTAAGGGYSLTAVDTVTVTVEDDEAALTVSETADTVAEASGEAEYKVQLAKVPTGDVTVTPTSSDENAATVSPATLTFTQSDWDTDQTFTVTGVNDDAPGDRTANVTHAATGGGYSVTNANKVAVTVEDDDAGLTTSQSTRTVSEAAGEAWYTVVLDVEPTANVEVTPKSSDTLAVKVSGKLTFTKQNWSTAQRVTVTGVSDEALGNRTAVVAHTAAGAATH